MRKRNWKSATTPLPKLKVIDRSPIVTLRNAIIENPVLDHLSFETLLELRESLHEHEATLQQYRLFQRARRVSRIEQMVEKKIQEECDRFRDYGSSPAKLNVRQRKEALVRQRQKEILSDFDGVWATEMYQKIHRGVDPAAEQAEYEQRYAEARAKLMQKFAAELSQFDSPEPPFVVVSVKAPQRRPIVASSMARFVRASPAKRVRVAHAIVSKAGDRIGMSQHVVEQRDASGDDGEGNVLLAEDRLKFASTEVFVPSSPRNIFDAEQNENENEPGDIREVATEPHLPLTEDHLKFVSTEVFVPSSPRNIFDDVGQEDAPPGE